MSAMKAVRNPAFLLTFLLLLATAVAMGVLPGYMGIYLRKLEAPSRKHMREVPRTLASWEQVGQDRQEAEDILKALGTDNTITRLYVERDPPAGSPPLAIELHLAYYTGMVDTVPHVSERCMVGGGWQPLTGSVVVPVELDASSWRRVDRLPESVPESVGLSEIRLPVRVRLPYGLVARDERDDRFNNVVNMRISDFVDPKSDAVSIIGYFFIANNRLTPSANDVRQLAFRLEDDYAYYVKVQFSVSVGPGGGGPRRVATAADLARVVGGPRGFISELLPEVMLCLPDWVQLEEERRLARREAASKTE
jgi:hypothetical protein